MTAAPILVVEDNDTNLFILLAMLRKSGRSALVARDGVEGVELAAAHAPRLVLMDLGLPRLDGVAAAAEIRRRLGRERPAIVAVTADATEARRRTCDAAGFDGLLTKPVSFAELSQVVSRWTAEAEPV